MTADEALALLNELLKEQKLKNIHELVFCYSWQGLTYPEIAKQVGYDTSYIRNIGQELWSQLSQAFEERVTKKNIQSVLRRKLAQNQHAASANQSEKEAASFSQADSEPPLLERSNLSVNTNQYQHWGEAIDVSTFYGRQAEMAMLHEWIESDCCRLVAVVGMGGIGKTALAAKLAEQLQNKFDYLVWQSLRNAPPIEIVLTQLLKIFANQQEVIQAGSLDGQISQLIERLRS
ncbi:MAG TPA: ATP-binding protein, partial [Oculatellaceae cyanobacterium]